MAGAKRRRPGAARPGSVRSVPEQATGLGLGAWDTPLPGSPEPHECRTRPSGRGQRWPGPGLCGAPVPPVQPARRRPTPGAGVTAWAPGSAPVALSLPQPPPQSRSVALPATVKPDPPAPPLSVSTHGTERPHVTLRPQSSCSPPLPGSACAAAPGSPRGGARGGAIRSRK